MMGIYYQSSGGNSVGGGWKQSKVFAYSKVGKTPRKDPGNTRRRAGGGKCDLEICFLNLSLSVSSSVKWDSPCLSTQGFCVN